MQNGFENKVAIVTGASTGIGAETAIAFARAGAQVILAARNEANLRAVIDTQPALRHRLLAVPTDVTQDADVARLVSTTINRQGRVDILVNNAGFGMRAPVADLQMDDARRLMDVNFFGLLRCTQAVIPHMKRQGSGQIVNVGSILSMLATPRNSIYCASKFAVRAFSEALRLELRDAGVEVILIMPGFTDTPFFENQVRYGGPVRIGPMKGQHPAKVAQAILEACAKHKRAVALTIPGNFGILLKKCCPRFLDWVLARAP